MPAYEWWIQKTKELGYAHDELAQALNAIAERMTPMNPTEPTKQELEAMDSARADFEAIITEMDQFTVEQRWRVED